MSLLDWNSIRQAVESVAERAPELGSTEPNEVAAVDVQEFVSETLLATSIETTTLLFAAIPGEEAIPMAAAKVALATIKASGREKYEANQCTIVHRTDDVRA